MLSADESVGWETLRRLVVYFTVNKLKFEVSGILVCVLSGVEVTKGLVDIFMVFGYNVRGSISLLHQLFRFHFAI